MLTGLDLDKSSQQLMVEIMSHYDARLDLADYSRMSIDKFPFTTASFHNEEGPFKGGLKAYFYRQYLLLDIRRNYGLDIVQWLRQDLVDIYRQIDILPDILHERKAIMENVASKQKQ